MNELNSLTIYKYRNHIHEDIQLHKKKNQAVD